MENRDFDRIEETYKRSVLKNSSKSNIKKGSSEMRRRNSRAKKRFSFIMTIVSILVIGFAISSAKKDRRTKVKEEKFYKNSAVVDEIVLVDVSGNQIKTEEKVEIKDIDSETEIENIEIEDKTVVKEKNKEKNINVKVASYYIIQVVASKNLDLVKKRTKELKKQKIESYHIIEGKNPPIYKLWLSKKFNSRTEANDYAKKLLSEKVINGDYWVRIVGKE